MTEPLVSIVIPFLNAQHFLAETLASVQSQAYTNWEVILVDDGSTDGSASIAQDFSSRFAGRATYLTHPNRQNRGISPSKNLALASARGKYVAFLDADDVWFPHTLQRQVALLESMPDVAMVYGTVRVWSCWSGQESSESDFEPALRHPNSRIDRLELFRMVVQGLEVPWPCAVLIRMDVLRLLGGVPEGSHGTVQSRNRYEDRRTYCAISLRYPVYAAGDCWAYYRQHQDSLVATSRSDNQSNRSRADFLIWLRSHLRQTGVTNRSVKSLVRKELRPLESPGVHRAMCWASRCWAAGRDAIVSAARGVMGRRSGRIFISPNPAFVGDGGFQASVHVSWSIRRTDAVEIRVGAPDGPVFASATESGTQETGAWVTHGLTFYLLDASSNTTLARVAATVLAQQESR